MTASGDPVGEIVRSPPYPTNSCHYDFVMGSWKKFPKAFGTRDPKANIEVYFGRHRRAFARSRRGRYVQCEEVI